MPVPQGLNAHPKQTLSWEGKHDIYGLDILTKNQAEMCFPG